MTTIRHGWLHLATGAGLGRIIGFFSNLLLTRWLGPVDLGLFNLVTTTVQTTDTLVRCGCDYALNYELGGQPNLIRTDTGQKLALGLSQLCSVTTILACIIIGIWVWIYEGLFPITLSGNERLVLTSLLLLMIFCEGISASAWEILLVSHRTASLALRQGLFIPLRLLTAAVGALIADVTGAMAGWSLIAIVQCIWLRSLSIDIWRPFKLRPFFHLSVAKLLKRGVPFYASNLLSSLIFYPLLLLVANRSGLAEVGYLRVGSVLQQLFAFLPSTLVPVLFLELRSQSTFKDQVHALEKPLRIIWFILLEVLIIYCAFDRLVIVSLFGDEFISALLPSRVLLITALFECLSQLTVQPLLATGRTRSYALWQNGSAVFAALLGWLWIPSSGVSAYLFVRLLYVIIPFIGFGKNLFTHLQHLKLIIPVAFASFALLLVFSTETLNDSLSILSPPVYLLVCLSIGFFYRKDLLVVYQSTTKRT